MRRRVLEEHHDAPHAGHPGREETARQIEHTYYWENMQRDIVGYVRSCLICASTKRGVIQTKAPLRPHKPQAPWEILSIDILGPYERTQGNSRYAIVIMDTFSKWVEAKPSPTASAKGVVAFTEEVCARFGYPRQIISDNGGVFRSNVFEGFLQRNHIEGFIAPTEHQQANPVERRVQEIKKMLRVEAAEHPTTWAQKLPAALYALRTRQNAAIGISPSNLLFGYRIRRPGEWTVPQAIQPPQPPREERIARALRRQAVYQRNLFPTPREAPVTFNAGDMVMVRTTSPRPNFGLLWTGPHRITRRRGDGVYDVLKNGAEVPRHIDDLRPAPPVREEMPIAPPGADGHPPDVDAEADGVQSTSRARQPAATKQTPGTSYRTEQRKTELRTDPVVSAERR